MTQPSRPPVAQMTPEQLGLWLTETRAALSRKMARERAYLDRRARRGARTPTDDAYETDQALEADILALFDEMIEQLPAFQQGYQP